MLLYMRKCICDYMCIFGAVATIFAPLQLLQGIPGNNGNNGNKPRSNNVKHTIRNM